MRIGILSDSHNHTANVRKALQIFRREGVDLLVHCGDMTTPETAQELVEFRLICVFGNGDYLSGEIRQTLLAYNRENYAGNIFEGEVDGVTVAVLHGHQEGAVEALARSGKFCYVLHGHTHTRRNELMDGVWVVNPGALGGSRGQSRSVGVLDVQSGALKFFEVEEN